MELVNEKGERGLQRVEDLSILGSKDSLFRKRDRVLVTPLALSWRPFWFGSVFETELSSRTDLSGAQASRIQESTEGCCGQWRRELRASVSELLSHSVSHLVSVSHSGVSPWVKSPWTLNYDSHRWLTLMTHNPVGPLRSRERYVPDWKICIFSSRREYGPARFIIITRSIFWSDWTQVNNKWGLAY